MILFQSFRPPLPNSVAAFRNASRRTGASRMLSQNISISSHSRKINWDRLSALDWDILATRLLKASINASRQTLHRPSTWLNVVNGFTKRRSTKRPSCQKLTLSAKTVGRDRSRKAFYFSEFWLLLSFQVCWPTNSVDVTWPCSAFSLWSFLRSEWCSWRHSNSTFYSCSYWEALKQVCFLSLSFWRWKWFLLKSVFCAVSSSKFSLIWAKFWLPFWRSGNETGESSSSWQPFPQSSFSSTGQFCQNPPDGSFQMTDMRKCKKPQTEFPTGTKSPLSISKVSVH